MKHKTTQRKAGGDILPKKPFDNKSLFILVYDFIFFALALVAVFFSIRDITTGITQTQIYIENIIDAIFIVDYIVRLCLAKKKSTFFKENIFDLIAIIPYNSIFKVFRLLKIFNLFKLLMFIRVAAHFARFYKRVKDFFNLTGFKYMVFASVGCIIVGGIAIQYFEKMSLFDGIWWSFVTTTTVGYGDLSPSTPIGRIIAAILMIIGIGLIGSLTSTITAMFFQRNTEAARKNTKYEIISTVQTQLDHFDDLTDDDIETICQTLHTLHDKNKK